ncbi:MAG: hypothetical protein U0166_16615 [Acidobacteriota bacterium]
MQADYQSDFIHPSLSGQQKVADMLSAFVASDPSTAFYWPKQGVAQARHGRRHGRCLRGRGESRNQLRVGTPLRLHRRGTCEERLSQVRRVGSERALAFFGKLEIRGTPGFGADVGVADTPWSEGTITFTSAPPIGAAFTTFAFNNRDGDHAAEVTSQVNADADGIVSFGLHHAGGGLGLGSKEEGSRRV